MTYTDAEIRLCEQIAELPDYYDDFMRLVPSLAKRYGLVEDLAEFIETTEGASTGTILQWLHENTGGFAD